MSTPIQFARYEFMPSQPENIKELIFYLQTALSQIALSLEVQQRQVDDLNLKYEELKLEVENLDLEIDTSDFVTKSAIIDKIKDIIEGLGD